MAEPDRASYAPITDHVAGGLALLTDRWRGLPAVEAILTAYLVEVQAIEDTAAEILALTIDAASDDQLAQYGVLLGTADPGVAKVIYRRLLRGAAAAIGSSGAGDELLAVLDAIGDVGETFTLREYFPASLVVEPAEAIAVPTSALHAVLRRAVAGGVRLHTIDVPTGDTFAFSDTDETVTDAARGFSDTAGLVGGQLVGVIE
jgi:hypothetical protein